MDKLEKKKLVHCEFRSFPIRAKKLCMSEKNQCKVVFKSPVFIAIKRDLHGVNIKIQKAHCIFSGCREVKINRNML